MRFGVSFVFFLQVSEKTTLDLCQGGISVNLNAKCSTQDLRNKIASLELLLGLEKLSWLKMFELLCFH